MAVDKNRGDVRLGFGHLVNTDGVVPPDRTDEALGQQSDAETGADRAINRLDITEFERPNAHYAALNQDIFEYLTVRASLRVNNDFDITLAGQIIETSDCTRRQDDELLAKEHLLDQVLVVDRTANESALDQVIQNLRD
jgi:hypothetical protein